LTRAVVRTPITFIFIAVDVLIDASVWAFSHVIVGSTGESAFILVSRDGAVLREVHAGFFPLENLLDKLFLLLLYFGLFNVRSKFLLDSMALELFFAIFFVSV
jgi:hypothetical protein